MPAKSKSQQKAAGLALSAKRGKTSPKELKGAAKDMYDSMSEKELEDYAETKTTDLPEKKEDTILDGDILTERQKIELKKIIDSLVEERVQKKNKRFVDEYTKFIAESATTKIANKIKDKLVKRIDEEMKTIRKKAGNICRSVVLESSSKMNISKRKQRELLEQFKETAPKLIKNLAEEQSKEYSADAIQAVEEKKKLEESINSIMSGMKRAGFIINEDLDKVIEKEKNEKKMLRTKLAKTRRDLKLAQLTEGMLPAQKKEIETLLEDCTTENQIEDRFLIARKKVMDSNKLIEEDHVSQEARSKMEETEKMLEEEDRFSQFIKAAKTAVNAI